MLVVEVQALLKKSCERKIAQLLGAVPAVPRPPSRVLNRSPRLQSLGHNTYIGTCHDRPSLSACWAEMSSRKDELLAKKARLAELKRQRELRQEQFASTRQSLGGGEVRDSRCCGIITDPSVGIFAR